MIAKRDRSEFSAKSLLTDLRAATTGEGSRADAIVEADPLMPQDFFVRYQREHLGRTYDFLVPNQAL